MRMNKNGEFVMSRAEITEFSAWLNNNPRERYKRFNEVVHAFLQFKESFSDDREVSYVC